MSTLTYRLELDVTGRTYDALIDALVAEAVEWEAAGSSPRDTAVIAGPSHGPTAGWDSLTGVQGNWSIIEATPPPVAPERVWVRVDVHAWRRAWYSPAHVALTKDATREHRGVEHWTGGLDKSQYASPDAVLAMDPPSRLGESHAYWIEVAQ